MSVPVPPGLYREPSRGAPAYLPTPAPQASDPTILPSGQVVPRQAMPVAEVGDAFSVDLASAPQVLRDLETARSQLEELRLEAFRLGRIDPGVNDEVSRDAAVVFGLIAVGGAGSLLAAIDGGVRRLDDLIGALRTDLSAYRTAETGNGAEFGERSRA